MITLIFLSQLLFAPLTVLLLLMGECLTKQVLKPRTKVPKSVDVLSNIQAVRFGLTVFTKVVMSRTHRFLCDICHNLVKLAQTFDDTCR